MVQRLNMIVDRVLAGLLGDAEHSEPARPALMIDQLSDWLPYRVYDPSNRLYLNARSKGFVLSVTPLIGADERTGEILGQFFSEGLPPGSCLQVLHLASPRISRIIAPWFAPRYLQGGVYEAIARHRAKRLYGLVWKSGSADAPFHARHHQVIVSVGVPAAKAVSNEELRQTRDGLMAMLKSLNLGVVEVGPEDLIAIIDDLTSPTTAQQEDALAYNPHDAIAAQAIRHDIELIVQEDRMRLATERFRPTGKLHDGVPEIGTIYPDAFDVRHFSVRNTPARWAPWECARLIGDLFTDKLRFPCPAATMLCLVYPDQEAAAAKAGFKFMRTTSLSETRSARFLPRIGEQAAEWQHVQAELQEGRRLVRVFYGLTTFSPLGRGDSDERAIKSIYKAAGWDLADERFLQIQGLLAAMPMTLADGLGADMERLKRFKTVLSTTAANMAPMQGEYTASEETRSCAIPLNVAVETQTRYIYWCSEFGSGFEEDCTRFHAASCERTGFIEGPCLQWGDFGGPRFCAEPGKTKALAALLAVTPITEAQKELLQVASIPLYKILTVQAAYGRGMPTDDRETLAEIASVDLLFAVLDRIVSESGRSMSSFIGADEAKIAMWQGQVNVVRQALADRQANTHLKVGAIMQIIEKTAFIENVLAASMSPGMSASLDWSRGVQSRALSQ